MANKYVIDENTLTDIADAIRLQYDSDDNIAVTNMADLIAAIESGTESIFPNNISVSAITLVSDTSNAVSIPHGLGKTPDYAVVFYCGTRKPYAFLMSISVSGGYSVVTGNGGGVTSKTAIRLTLGEKHVTVDENGTYYKRSGTYYCVAISFT